MVDKLKRKKANDCMVACAPTGEYLAIKERTIGKIKKFCSISKEENIPGSMGAISPKFLIKRLTNKKTIKKELIKMK